MDLFLRKVIHPQARDNYRVIPKDDGVEIEVGSIGVQFDGWHWGIDSIVPMGEEDGEGSGKDRAAACGSSGLLGTAPARSRLD
jgi:hypothetical protein